MDSMRGVLGVVLIVLVAAAGADAQPTGLTGQTERKPFPGGYVERAADVGIVHSVYSGLDRINGTVMYGWSQTGIGLGDFDGDGDLDVVAAGGTGPNAMFRNDGGTFVDVTNAVGINAGEIDRSVAVGDVDNDGDLDVFFGAVDRGAHPLPGRSRLYHNDGNGIFTEATSLAATVGSGHSLFAKFHDVDLDGWLDLYVGEFHGTDNHFYLNNGDGTFSDVSVASGMDIGSSTHVVAVADLDKDLLPEVLVGNDYKVNNATGMGNDYGDAQMVNQGDGTWIDMAPATGYHQDEAIMGLTVGDVNYDGWPDVYKTDVNDNHLLVNHDWLGTGQTWTKEDVAYGVEQEDVPDVLGVAVDDNAIGWSTFLFYADFDPWLDLFVANGHIPGASFVVTTNPMLQQNYLFEGLGPGAGFAFKDATKKFGLLDNFDDRGAALGDMDADGDPDLFVVPSYGPVRYFENRVDRDGQGGVTVRAETTTSAPDGVGVVIERVDGDGYHHSRFIGADAPTASTSANEVFFALGHEQTSDFDVQFPSGLRISYADVPTDSVLVATEPLLFTLSERKFASAAAGGGDRATMTVTAFAHAQDGTPLDGTATVQIEAAGLLPIGPVTHVAGNEFRREFRAPITEGRYNVELFFDGFAVNVKPSVICRGVCDAAMTSVLADTEAVRAGTTDEWTLTVAPKDAQGMAMGAGLSVLAQVGGVTPTSATDLGDGQYRFTFDAPAAPGSYDVDLAIEGEFFDDVRFLDAAGPVDAAVTATYTELPWPLQQAGPHQYKLEVTPMDADGRRLGAFADVQLVVTPDVGSAPLTVRTDMQAHQRDGNVTLVFEKPLDMIFGPLAFGSYEVIVDGVSVHADTFSY